MDLQRGSIVGTTAASADVMFTTPLHPDYQHEYNDNDTLRSNRPTLIAEKQERPACWHTAGLVEP